MAATRTQGITVDSNGNLTIDKEHRGVRICFRLGPLSQEDAEHRLDAEIARVESELEHKAASQPRFADCAARYLAESQHKRSVSLVAWHIRLLYPYLGNLEVNRVHDRTLEPFIADRVAAGVTATTINRSLEVVRTILNRSARSYRDDDGRPWLDALPPLITMLPETPRLPYPITWETDCSRSCLHALVVWRSSPSTRACARATSADWNGRGRFPCPRWAAVCS